MIELDLAPGDYTITEDASGVSTTVTVASGSWVADGLMYWAPPDSPIDVTLGDGRGSETENWQQVTWEGLSISYPPAQTFYPQDNAASIAGESTSAILQPDDCAGTGMDCEILEFRLITNEGGLSAEEWAVQNKRVPADARNFREVIIAGQTGIAFETGDPDSYPGESSFNAVPVGTKILEINGVGYQDVLEQIVASITVSSPSGEALLPAEFGGTWTGTVQQYEDTAQGAPQETYPVELTLTAGAVGPVVGTITYPTLGCGGELTWLDMTSDSITLSETITSDDTSDGGSCADDGSMSLRFVDEQTLAWTWYWPDGTQGAEATLTKEETRAPETITVFLEGIGSELTPAQIAQAVTDESNGTCADHDPTFGDIKRALLKQGSTCADFLRFSYAGSSEELRPTPYSCADTGQHLDKSVDILMAMLHDYRQAHPDVRFVLIGHSLGGVIALESVRRAVNDPQLPAGSINAVITIDSPLNHVSYQNALDTQHLIDSYSHAPRLNCNIRLLIGSDVGADLSDVTNENRQAIRQDRESLVRMGQAAGIRFMTIGNAYDCVWYLTLCALTRDPAKPGYDLGGEWIDDRDSMVIENADRHKLYTLQTPDPCDLSNVPLEDLTPLVVALGCLRDGHSIAMKTPQVIQDISAFLKSP